MAYILLDVLEAWKPEFTFSSFPPTIYLMLLFKEIHPPVSRVLRMGQSIFQTGEDCHRKTRRMTVLATPYFINDLKKLLVILPALPQKGDATLVLANSTQELPSLDVFLELLKCLCVG